VEWRREEKDGIDWDRFVTWVDKKKGQGVEIREIRA
jgi:hypothetical protein